MPATTTTTKAGRFQPAAAVWEQLRKNLFSPWYNALITIVSALIIYVVVKGTLQWVLYGAHWRVVSVNLENFAMGPYPRDQAWRVLVALGMVVFLGGLSLGAWGRRSYAPSAVTGLLLVGVLVAPLSASVRLHVAAILAAFGVGHLVAMGRSRLQRYLVWAWLASFFATLILLRGFKGSETMPLVQTGLWGGLVLTVLLAVVAIVASFPFGVLLALGRRSKLPIVKLFSIIYIELIRGVPLVTVLFMSQIILPLFLPPNVRIDKVLRAMTGMTLFAAAYLAENVRGGLQAIPIGQYEAAHALGLNYYQTMRYIVLPQALRAVIPAIVGQFIGLFKDTSLVAIVGLLDLLGIALSVINQPEFIGLQREVFLFIAVIYWVFSYAMSYASRRLEVKLGVGVR